MASKEAQSIEEGNEAGASLFIGKYFRVSKPGMIIDSQMDILPPGPPVVALVGVFPDDPMPHLLEAPQPFDVDVNHVNGGFAFVAPHRFFGRQGGKATETQSATPPSHRRTRGPCLDRDPPRAHPLTPQAVDLCHLVRRFCRLKVIGMVGPVQKPSFALGPKPTQPFINRGGLTRLMSPGDQRSIARRQFGILVDVHGRSFVACGFSQNSHTSSISREQPIEA